MLSDEITFYVTPSHGGFHVTGSSARQIPQPWRDLAEKRAGEPNWYEEDGDWAGVALTFPALFTAEELDTARLIERQLTAVEFDEARLIERHVLEALAHAAERKG